MNKKNILLVEDNPDDEALTLRALRKNNIACEIIVMRDGEQALNYLLTSDDNNQPATSLPEIILLDLKLPKVDGLEVLHQIRNNSYTRRVPVIILTTSSEESDITACYDIGANSYICKPVDFDQFVETVRQLGLYWLELNRSKL